MIALLFRRIDVRVVLCVLMHTCIFISYQSVFQEIGPRPYPYVYNVHLLCVYWKPGSVWGFSDPVHLHFLIGYGPSYQKLIRLECRWCIMDNLLKVVNMDTIVVTEH